jgi:hypothetical protein
MIKGDCVLTARSVKLMDLACSLCNKLFHKKCVPHHHKMHIPEEEEDSYVCHMCFQYAYSSSDMALDDSK